MKNSTWKHSVLSPTKDLSHGIGKRAFEVLHKGLDGTDDSLNAVSSIEETP